MLWNACAATLSARSHRARSDPYRPIHPLRPGVHPTNDAQDRTVKLALERGFHPIILETAYPAHASEANSEARCLRPVNWGGNDFHSSSFHVLASQVMPHLRIVTLN